MFLYKWQTRKWMLPGTGIWWAHRIVVTWNIFGQGYSRPQGGIAPQGARVLLMDGTAVSVSLAHNRRDFVAENVNPNRVYLNICYRNENLKDVYKELFDESVERYNVGTPEGDLAVKVLDFKVEPSMKQN